METHKNAIDKAQFREMTVRQPLVAITRHEHFVEFKHYSFRNIKSLLSYGCMPSILFPTPNK